jgi:spore germination protein
MKGGGNALRTLAIGVVLAVVAGSIGWLAAGGVFEAEGAPGVSGSHGGTAGAGGGTGTGGGNDTGSGDGTGSGPTASNGGPTATPRPPTGGTELYGYLPYWQMTDAMTWYLAEAPVRTLALFSMTATSSGGLKRGDIGYSRITGPRGRGIIAAAHGRGQRVELVFTSFGYRANARLFGDDPKAQLRRARATRELAALASDLGVDGINVDVELIDGDYNDGYAAFVAGLRTALRQANPHATVTVATTAGHGGADRARASIAGGADRVFLMGYDYHWSGSDAGAASPIDGRDGVLDLEDSIESYVNAGVPRDKILLGLPLYGMSWPVAGPGRAAEVIGSGSTWIPSAHTDVLLAPGFTPAFDVQEIADWFAVPKGSGWVATYYDSPRSLSPKLALARSQGLAGAGFWALGYDRGLPGYLDLMGDFVAGRIGDSR